MSAELEQQLYEPMRRRSFLKLLVGAGAAVAFGKYVVDLSKRSGDYTPKNTPSPEEEARRKLEDENFEYLAKRMGLDGAWIIRKLSETNSNFFDLQMHKLSRDYIDQNFRRYDGGPVIVGGTEETYKRIGAALDLGKEKTPEDYQEAMEFVHIIRIYKNEEEAGYPGLGVITTRNQEYGSIAVVEDAIPAVENSVGFINLAEGILCHEKNHIKYPDYTEEQIVEVGIPCQKKLGIIK